NGQAKHWPSSSLATSAPGTPLTKPSHPADSGWMRRWLTGGMAAAPPARKGITRRQALSAAVAAGVGVGAVRLLGGALQNLGRTGTVVASGNSGGDWVSPLGSESARVMHLLRRATFGYTPAQLDSALSEGFSRTVDRLIQKHPAEPTGLS